MIVIKRPFLVTSRKAEIVSLYAQAQEDLVVGKTLVIERDHLIATHIEERNRLTAHALEVKAAMEWIGAPELDAVECQRQEKELAQINLSELQLF